ncbi:hypothetical protein J41TS12_04220 [Paenibacillus antibioticophila]|uniref:Uncharacterized protein n=1 Tax=Paenibacillus antibioticophila TaxID=1274374 RepID=A0A920CD85_9BACL|nr:hypothetical protein J41TS12_04220 [Paenibacillus antibioticophila]
MKHEGTLRQQLRKGEVYEDLHYYGILRSDGWKDVNAYGR